MGYIVRMPQMGMSMEEGTVVEWLVAEGDAVEEGETIVEVESEKTINEVEARECGVLRRIVAPESSVVEPGTPIGIVAGQDEDISGLEAEIDEQSVDATAAAGQPADTGTATAGGDGGAGGRDGDADTSDVQATPGARQLASDEGVDLTGVEGSGPEGVIVESDVRDQLEADSESTDTTAEGVKATPGARQIADENAVDLAAVEGTGPSGVVTDDDVERHLDQSRATGGAPRTVVESRPLSGMQETISRRLSESDRDAVHVTLNRSFDATALQTVQAAAERAGHNVAFTDLILKAVAEVLDDHEEFNAVFEDGEHKLIEEINLGFAVDIEDGLLTPVIADVDDRHVEAVAERRQELTDRARSGAFSTDDLAGGTFTVSNLGMFGVDHFDPIIDPPQVAILGVGRVKDDGSMTLSLSFDHRLVNGADAARVLDALCARLTDRSTLRDYFDGRLAIDEMDPELERRTVRVETDAASGYSGRYHAADGVVAFDEPESAGGGGTAPSPVDHLLGAFGSCLALSVRAIADRQDVEFGQVHCDVTASPEDGPLEAFDVELVVETNADDATVEEVLTKAEQDCYVARSLSEDLSVSLDWTRR